MSTIIKAVEENKIIVIFRGIPEECLIACAKAVFDGGIRMIEIAFDASGKTSDEKTAFYIRKLCDCFGGELLVGAGTVLYEEQLMLAKNAGAQYIISPNADEKIIKKTKEVGLVSMPGAITPTEAQAAHTYGADFVKLFPIGNMGLEYFKSIKAPLSNIKFLAVGGISIENVREYINSGAYGVGVSSNILKKELVVKKDYKKISTLAEEYVKEVF